MLCVWHHGYSRYALSRRVLTAHFNNKLKEKAFILFSDAWLKRFLKHWNSSFELVSLLRQEEFSALIGYGLVDDEYPLFVLKVKSGRLVNIMRYRQQTLDWDLRASFEHWRLMIECPPGIPQLGLAYTQKRLICRKGKYSLMLKNSNLSKAFSASFKIMHQVEMA